MDRRNFLKTGGIALLGSLTTGSAMALATPGASVSYTHLRAHET